MPLKVISGCRSTERVNHLVGPGEEELTPRVDRLSALSDALLHHIMLFMEVWEVVRMCVIGAPHLGRHWCYCHLPPQRGAIATRCGLSCHVAATSRYKSEERSGAMVRRPLREAIRLTHPSWTAWVAERFLAMN